MQTEIHFMMASHMDLYWMGNARDCLDRGAEIIARAIWLCNKYEDYKFYVETTVFADWFLKVHPELKERFIELFHQGRIEIGGCYVDRYEHNHDGESILRQHVYGARWIKENLGIYPESTCHSDLPGLSPQIPQLVSKAGIKYYLRARGPFGTWIHEAPDGSEVIYGSLGHSYGKTNEEEIKEAVDSATEQSPVYLMRGGYGDLQMPDDDIMKMLEYARKTYPDIKFSISSPSKVLRCYDSADGLRTRLRRIKGEWPSGWASIGAGAPESYGLTFPAVSALTVAEKFAALAGEIGFKVPSGRKADWWLILQRTMRDMTPEEIPAGKELEEAWRAEMFTQDHNYFGYGGVKSEFDKKLIRRKIINYAGEIRDAAVEALAAKLPSSEGVRVAVINPSSWLRSDIVSIPLPAHMPENPVAVAEDGTESPCAVSGDSLIIDAADIPATGYRLYTIRTGGRLTNWYSIDEKGGGTVIDTGFFKLAINPDGSIGSILDKTSNRELTGGEYFGMLAAYESLGVDVIYHFTGKKLFETISREPVRITGVAGISVTIEITGTILDCKVIRKITLYRNHRKIDLSVTVGWLGEHNWNLRWCFPFNKERFKVTSYGVPFYGMEWPKMMEGVDDDTILGESDFREDELSRKDRYHFRENLKWVDCGYDNFGVTLCQNIPSVWIDNEHVEFSLLRVNYSCGDHSLWNENSGWHTWELSLIPHEGDRFEGKAEKHGLEFETPFIAVPIGKNSDGSLPGSCSLLDVSADNVIVSAVKPAYDNPEYKIVRFYETEGVRTELKLSSYFGILEAVETDLLEREIGNVGVIDGIAITTCNPFEVKTLKLKLGRA